MAQSIENTSHSAALNAALSDLAALHPKRIDLGLSRIEHVLEKLGNPQRKLPPIIHIAGTNGKGSTLSFIRAMAEAQGLTCHAYISPHLVRFNERITLASKQIDDARLIDVLQRVRTANDDAPLSFFEATTAAAFLAFSETPADLLLLEVGLGGRYDATNVITPDLSLITPIDYDHAEFLGTDIAGIAREKAGIMKPYTPIMIGKQTPQVSAVLDAEANKLGLTPKFMDQDFRSYLQHGRLVFEDSHSLLDLPAPALTGPHQIENAGLAIAAAKHIQLSGHAIAKGLETVTWPARLQCLTRETPLGGLAQIVDNKAGELWLDGGHNAHAARAVSNAMADLESRDPRPLILITAMLGNKDSNTYLSYFKSLAHSMIALDIPGHDSAPKSTLIEHAQSHGIKGHEAVDLEHAIQMALDLSPDPSPNSSPSPRILICGSLYLAGEALKL